MQSPRRSIVNSPWYWAYLFATAALIILIWMGPKIRERQSQIERNYQGRERANQRAQGEEPHGELSTPDNTIISLTPLLILFAIVMAAAGGLFWWTHFRSTEEPAAKQPKPLVDQPSKNSPEEASS